MRGQIAQELASGPRVLDVEHDVCAVVGLRPVAQHRRLDVVQVDSDTPAGEVAGAVGDGHRRTYSPILSRSSSTASPSRRSRRVSATVRSLATYQPSALIWYFAR